MEGVGRKRNHGWLMSYGRHMGLGREGESKLVQHSLVHQACIIM